MSLETRPKEFSAISFILVFLSIIFLVLLLLVGLLVFFEKDEGENLPSQTPITFVPQAHASETTPVSDFIFTTDRRIVRPGEMSQALTIRPRDGAGDFVSPGETMDLSFSSSSGTGEFLNSSGNPISSTMNSNWTSRTFYYRDQAVGEHALTVTATGRVSGLTFSASQDIIISDNPEYYIEEKEINDIEKKEILESVESAHSAQEDLSSYLKKTILEIDIGRERNVSVGGNVEFQAFVKPHKEIEERQVEISWSFGDGITGSGTKVSHKYEFPGEYAVIANARFKDERSVARTKVIVRENLLSITDVTDDFIEITNDASYEVNLYQYRLREKQSEFVFPKDTIIFPNRSIKFSRQTTGLPSGESGPTRLIGPQRNLLFSFDPQKHQIKSKEANINQFDNLMEQIAEARSQVKELTNSFVSQRPSFSTSNRNFLPSSVSQMPVVELPEEEKESGHSLPIEAAVTTSQNSANVEFIEVRNENTFMVTLTSVPKRIFEFFVNLF